VTSPKVLVHIRAGQDLIRLRSAIPAQEAVTSDSYVARTLGAASPSVSGKCVTARTAWLIEAFLSRHLLWQSCFICWCTGRLIDSPACYGRKEAMMPVEFPV